MEKMVRNGLAAAVALLFTACPGPAQISEGPPSGLFDGKAWTMVKASVTRDGDTLSVHLFGEEVADCASFPPSESTTGYVMWSMPAVEGSRPLKFDLFKLDDPATQTVTFVTPPSNNNIAVEGRIEVRELTDTTVDLGLMVEAGEGFELDGSVSTTLCE
jgi:hypothetical protein